MSNIIKVNITSLESKSLLTDPSIVTLDTKDKLMLSNISINLDPTNINILQSAIHSSATILGVKGLTSNINVGDLLVGSSVFMNVDGVRTEFLVVQQGIPNTTGLDVYPDVPTDYYDKSCNGTWLLMKNTCAYKTIHDSTASVYSFDDIDLKSYLETEFFNKLDSSIQNIVKTVQLPVQFTNLTSGPYVKNVSETFFLLSAYEAGFTYSEPNINYGNMHQVGICLDYFKGQTYDEVVNKRIAKDSAGNYASWWTRDNRYVSSPQDGWWHLDENGKFQPANTYNSKCGVRPALILPSDTKVDEDFNIICIEEDCTNGHKWSPIDEGYHECLRCGILEECKDFRYEPHEGGGTHIKICIDCGYVYKDDEACDITYTNNGDGTHTGKCNLCGYTFTENHDTYSYSGKAPTCSSAGYYGGTACHQCNYETGGGYRAPTGNHNYSVVQSTSSGSCTIEGYTIYKCSNCSATKKVLGSTNPSKHEGPFHYEGSGGEGSSDWYRVCESCGRRA
jgi:hypothetical protein